MQQKLNKTLRNVIGFIYAFIHAKPIKTINLDD